MNQREYDKDIYFAHLPTDEIGSAILDRRLKHNEYIKSHGMFDNWLHRHNVYYGIDDDTFLGSTEGIQRRGENGEYYYLNQNHLRSVLKSMINIAVQNKPVFDVRSVNTDSDSNQLAGLGQILIDYYMHSKNVYDKMQAAVEHSVLFDRGYMLLQWDTTLGREHGENIDPETGQIVYDGDIRVSVPKAFDVAFDPYKQSFDQHDWFIITEYVNKWDLAAQNRDDQEVYDAILNDKNQHDETLHSLINNGNNTWRDADISDEVPVLLFMHRPTEAVPFGRWVRCLLDGTVLVAGDQDLPYEEIPLISMTPDEHVGNSFGYSPISMLMPMQETLNSLNSTIVSNQLTYGVSFVALPRGTNMDARQLGRGLWALDLPESGHAPQTINLTQTPGEIFGYREQIMAGMSQAIGMSETSIGAPPKYASGNRTAMDASITAQNQGSFQAAYGKMAGQMATILLKMLKHFANNERTVSVLGKHSTGRKTFSAPDLQDLDTVIAELGNPMNQNLPGRMSVAETLAGRGMINAQQYFEVLTSGNLENALEGPREELNYIRRENEMLLDAKKVNALSIENHQAHIEMHKRILLRADIREGTNPNWQQITQATLAHIQEHDYYIQSAQNMQLQAMQAQASIQQGQNAGPGRPPNAQGIKAPGIGGDPTVEELGLVSPDNPQVQNANDIGVGMPQIPKNPQTGQRATPN